MNRFELQRALRAAGVPDALYEIPGCTQGPYPADRYFLEERPGGVWAVGVHERGTREVVEQFPTESEACAWLHTRLTENTAPPPTQLTPEEQESLLRTPEATRRRHGHRA
ncbi:hypothetical protein [Streptomyces sp. YIM S03343]